MQGSLGAVKGAVYGTEATVHVQEAAHVCVGGAANRKWAHAIELYFVVFKDGGAAGVDGRLLVGNVRFLNHSILN